MTVEKFKESSFDWGELLTIGAVIIFIIIIITALIFSTKNQESYLDNNK